MKMLSLFIIFLFGFQAFSDQNEDFSRYFKERQEVFYSQNGCNIVYKTVTKKKKGNTTKKVVKKRKYKKGKLVKKVRRVVFIDENGNKTFKSPYQVNEIDNNNPDLLTLELDSKDIASGEEKFVPILIKYKVFKPEDNYKDRKNKITADLYEIDGKKRFNVDISELEAGDYSLFLRIVSHKTKHLNNPRRHRKPVRFVHIAGVDFTKEEIVIADTAHAVLTEVNVSENINRISFDMSGSFSDIGEIESFIVRVFKDGSLINSFSSTPTDGSTFEITFSENGTYTVELEVNDGSDTDTARSIEYTPLKLLPVIKYTITEGSTQTPDIYSIDFTDSFVGDPDQINSYYVFILKDGISVEQFSSTTPIFNLQIQTRGDFQIAPLISTSAGE